MESNQIMVSIWCRTYNHVKYIRDALDGFILQRTNFRFQVVVFDDASTDGTSDIVREYAEKYPELIIAIIAEENTWHRPRNENHKMSRGIWERHLVGKYISYCEGDDFWIDPNKLQIQVDYLEEHPECMMICHDAVVIDYSNFKIYPHHTYFEERYLTEEEVIIQYRGDFPTASTTIRRDLFNLSGFFAQCPLGDYTHELYAITKGKIYFSPRIMSVYRSMHEGSWCRAHSDNIEKGILLRGNVIDFLREYDTYTEGAYHHAIIYKESLFILDCIYLCYNLNTAEIEKIIQKCNEKTNNQYENFLMHVEAVYKQMNEEEYFPSFMKEFVERYEHIYIWGAGKYGQRVARQLLNHNKGFEAFIVSEPVSESVSEPVSGSVSEPSGRKVMGKPVIGVEGIPYSMESVGIIVAVNVQNWDELRGHFEKDGKFHYIYPYGVTEIIK